MNQTTTHIDKTEPANKSSGESKIANLSKWAFLGLSIFFIIYIYQKTLNPLIEDRAQILKEAYYINELQNSILETVTLSQKQRIQQFDRINAQTNSLKTVLNNLSATPGIRDTPQLLTQAQDLLQKSQQQEKHLELFKSFHAINQNSLRYLPTAYRECFINLNQKRTAKDFLSEITLIQDTLILALTINRQPSNNGFSQLTKMNNQLANSQLKPLCSNFIKHNQILIDYALKEDDIYQQLHSIGLDRAIHNFYLNIEKHTSSAIAQNNTYYIILSLFALLLLGYVGYTLNSLYKINNHLSKTLSQLSEQQGLFTTLIKVNTAIAKIHEQTPLLQEVCDITTKEAHLDHCWIGLIDQNNTVTPVVASGIGKEVVMQIRPSIDSHSKDGFGSGTIAESYRTNAAVITDNHEQRMANTPWALMVQEWGVRASATIPIKVDNTIIGFFVCYTRRNHFFTDKINLLLEQLISDLGIALKKIQLESEQKQRQQDLAVAAIAFESHEAIIITDATNRIIRANNAFSKLTGYSLDECIGKTPNILKSGLHEEAFYQSIWKQIHKTGKWQGEIWNRKKDGTLYPSWQSISTLFDDEGNVTHYISHAMDLTKDKESQREIYYLNNHDNLTKLPNRTLLIDRLDQQLGQNLVKYSFLFLININRFKIINESLGHTAGDHLLIQVSKRLKNLNLENVFNTTIARIGNDEFAVLCLTELEALDNATLEAGHIAKQIQNDLSQGFNIHDNNVVINTSIGVTLFTPNRSGKSEQTPETLLQEANTALHRAKQSSLSSVQFFEANMQLQAQKRLTLETSLRTALNNKEFELHYQPQISLETQQIIGLESLIRWRNKEHKLIPPNDFIPILEETGIITPVSIWVIEEAITQAKILNKYTPNLTMSVNLSAVQFNDPNLVTQVKQILNRTNYPADKLEFE
ncbi:MAG: diguanylate cyclase, partial [Thiomicrorhabdus sp.]|nr:diguanylate cyclase [Thiomicrorhabdus sp.]